MYFVIAYKMGEKGEKGVRMKKVSGTFYSVSKSRPYGDDNWINVMVKKFGLGITLRQRGRPRKGS